MTIGNNKRNLPRYSKKVFSGIHKPLSEPKLKPKLSVYGKHKKSTLTEMRERINSSK
jgi:hypothetical protein